MPLAIPNELKKIAPFVKRAEELDKDKTAPESRLVAYYCRQYAVHLGIPSAGASPGAKTCLGHLLNDLEKEKPAMDNFTRDEASFLCRKFAEAVFDKADNDDRSGNAGKATAKTFYAAASFLQMLEQFASDSVEETEQIEEDKKKIVYSKWKATEILKALKEGRTPTPGGYGEQEAQQNALDNEIGNDELPPPPPPAKDEGVEMSTGERNKPVVETVSDDDNDDGGGGSLDDLALPPPPPTTTLPPPVAPPPPITKNETDSEVEDEILDEGTEVELGPPPAYPGSSQNSHITEDSNNRPSLTFDLPAVEPTPPSPSKAKSSGLFGFGKKKTNKEPTKAQIADAVELTRFALAALEDKDVDLGSERLKQALSVLGRQ